MRRFCKVVLLGLLLARPAGGAGAASGPAIPCVPASATRLTSFAALPVQVRADLLARFAPAEPPARREALAGQLIAAPGADWQVTDVLTPGRRLPGRRLILGVRSGPKLSIWYESGGIAHMTHVATYLGGENHWTLSQHMARAGAAELCRRIGGPADSPSDAYW